MVCSRPDTYEVDMDNATVRQSVKARLDDGRLPRNVISPFWTSHGKGQLCDACLRSVTESQVLMGAEAPNRRTIYFHARCLVYWRLEA
jgi:hypothetical protein